MVFCNFGRELQKKKTQKNKKSILIADYNRFKNMKRLIMLGLFNCLIISAVAQEYNYQNLTISFKEGANYTFKKLRLYPIRAKASFLPTLSAGKYVLLKEALEGKKIVISESGPVLNLQPNTRQNSRRNSSLQPATTPQQIQPTENPVPTENTVPAQIISGQPELLNMPMQQQIQQLNIDGGDGGVVNTLHFENTSKDTIYVMAGEIVQGGKQDRIVAQDLILLPNSGVVSVSVFCVEQGRWRFDEKSTDKNFTQYYGISSMNMRKKVEKESNQQAVWSEVRRSNNENNVQTATDAYTAQKDNLYLKQNTGEYITFFQTAFEKETQVIGVLVVTGDKVVGCDLFASPTLFKSQFSNLLTSYVTEALTDGAEVRIKATIAQAYMDNLLKDEESQKTFIAQKGKVFEHQNKKLRISTF